jgi:predicted DsbA family dithiol-disulfide isomerase
MESWCVGFDGNDDVERHAGMDGAGERARPAIRLRVVSDYICPWCFIGLTRLEGLRADFDISLETCAYELRPNIPPEGMPREQASAGRTYPPGYIENLLQTARDSGIEMKRPALVPNTRLAHEMTEFAAEQGKTWEVHRALFAAYFEQERNIGDIDVLCEVGETIGLDPTALRAALGSRRYRERIEEQLKWAVAAGVTGVPTVIYNERFAVVGAQDEMVFRDVAKRVASGRLEVVNTE